MGVGVPKRKGDLSHSGARFLCLVMPWVHYKESVLLWTNCPSCKQKFGVKPQAVLKYVDRLLNELEEKIEKKAKEALE